MMRAAWIPNLITMARIACALPLAWAIVTDRTGLALGLALAAGVSDVLDGWLAKHYGWQSRLGSLLDPVADKLLLIAAFVALVMAGALPLWLVGLVLLRDVIIVGGAVAWDRWIEPLRGEPTLLSKLTTLSQVVLIVVILISAHGLILPSPNFVGFAIALVAALTVISGLHYVVIWARRARRKRNAQEPYSP